MNNNNIGIYKIECIENGKIYIGASTRLHVRWTQHKYLFRKGTHQANMQADWELYGVDKMHFSVLERCSIEKLNEREEWWGNEYLSVDPDILYNVQPLGKSDYSEEKSKRISESNTENKFGTKTENASSKYYGVSWHKRDKIGRAHV